MRRARVARFRRQWGNDSTRRSRLVSSNKFRVRVAFASALRSMVRGVPALPRAVRRLRRTPSDGFTALHGVTGHGTNSRDGASPSGISTKRRGAGWAGAESANAVSSNTSEASLIRIFVLRQRKVLLQVHAILRRKGSFLEDSQGYRRDRGGCQETRGHADATIELCTSRPKCQRTDVNSAVQRQLFFALPPFCAEPTRQSLLANSGLLHSARQHDHGRQETPQNDRRE